MIYLYPQGGLGNLLFQIAAAHSAAIDNNMDFAIIRRNNIMPNAAGSDISEYENNIFSNCKFVSNVTPNFKGYFQDPKYFHHNKDKMLELFVIPEPVKPLDDYVAVHIRRTDYVRAGNKSETLSIDYYNRAMELFPGSNFLFFSDDIDWVKNAIPGYNYATAGNDLEQLSVMINANGHIIANSSYSWWAAYMSKTTKLIVAPDPWMQCNHESIESKIINNMKVISR